MKNDAGDWLYSSSLGSTSRSVGLVPFRSNVVMLLVGARDAQLGLLSWHGTPRANPNLMRLNILASMIR